MSTAPHEAASATQGGTRHGTERTWRRAWRAMGAATRRMVPNCRKTPAQQTKVAGNQPRAHTRRERHSSGHVSLQHPREACKPPHRARHNERSPIAGSRGQRRPPQLATAGHRSPRQCGHAATRVHADNARTRGEGRRLEGEAPLPQSSHSCNAQLLGSETAPTRRAQLRTPMLWLHARAKQQLIKRANFCRKLLKRNCLHGDDQMTHRAAMME